MTPKGEVWVLGENARKHLKVEYDANYCWQPSLPAAASTPFSLLWEELTLNLILIQFQFRKCPSPTKNFIPNISTLKKISDELFPYNVETSKFNYQHIWKWRKLNKVNDINQPTRQSNRAVKGTFSEVNFSTLQKLVFFLAFLGQTKSRDPPSPLWLRESKNEPI